MIIVLEPGLSTADVARVRRELGPLAGEAFAVVGVGRVVLLVTGDGGAAPPEDRLMSIRGVSQVVPAGGPHPLVAHDLVRQRSSVRVGSTVVGPDTFVLVAGPCAVEDAQQAGTAWAAAVAAGASLLRGDLIKHRTSPYSFQGLGAEGVELLRAQRRRSGLPMVLEVLSAQDVGTVAEVADALRVGSRNMQNRELLLECGRAGKPVMLKRGLSATVDEWLLAAETIASVGNLDIILCERGIRTFEAATRNTLDLSAVAVVQQRSHLPVIVDPSHASGRRSLVAPLTLAAVAAGADGVMLDVHPQPEAALCDGPQALVPAELVELAGRTLRLAEWMGRSTDARIAVPRPA